MFEYIDVKNQEFSFFSSGSILKGDFLFNGETHVASQIEGIVKSLDGGKITIETMGKICGNLECTDIEIHGTFEGTLVSRGVVTLHPTASFFGELKAKNLIIHPGAVVDVEAHSTAEES